MSFKGLSNSKWTQWLILLILTIVWGSSFILMKRGLEVFNSYEVAALRISFAFIFLLPFVFNVLRKLKLKNWLHLSIVGCIGYGFPPFLFTYAQTVLPSSVAGILNSTTPLFTLFIGILFYKTKAKWYNVIGIFIGLIGAIGLMAANGIEWFEFNLSYSIFIIIATFLYGINVNHIRKYLSDISSLHITSVAYLIIGVPSLIYTLNSGCLSKIQSDANGLIALVYVAILGIVGSALSLIIHNYQIKKTSALFASSVTYTIPIVAILWGVADAEPFSINYLLWIGLIIFGVYLVNMSRLFDLFKKIFAIKRL